VSVAGVSVPAVVLEAKFRSCDGATARLAAIEAALRPIERELANMVVFCTLI
jgi:hypothetical protein